MTQITNILNKYISKFQKGGYIQKLRGGDNIYIRRGFPLYNYQNEKRGYTNSSGESYTPLRGEQMIIYPVGKKAWANKVSAGLKPTANFIQPNMTDYYLRTKAGKTKYFNSDSPEYQKINPLFNKVKELKR